MKKSNISIIFILIIICSFNFIGCSTCNSNYYTDEIFGTWNSNNVQIIFDGTGYWIKKINGENNSSGYYSIDEKQKILEMDLNYYWIENNWVRQLKEFSMLLEYEWNENTLVLKNNDQEKEIQLNGIYTSPNFNGTVVRKNIGC